MTGVQTCALPIFLAAFQLRADEATVSIPVQEALRNAAKTEGREIEIPKAVD